MTIDKHTVLRWAIASVIAAFVAAGAGAVAVVAVSSHGPWKSGDVSSLTLTAIGIAYVGAAAFIPFTFVASLIPNRLRVAVPPALVSAIGFASYFRRFGLQSPTSGDRQFIFVVIWSALVVGQIVHAFLLLSRRRPAAV